MKLTHLIILTLLTFCLYANHVWSASDLLTVSFLDIEQGDSILIRTAHGRTVLIDGGPGTSVLERLGEETSFWQHSFDLLILTHPDLDHLEGLVEVLPRYQVDHVLLTGVMHGSRLYQEFLQRLIEYGVETHIASPELDWLIDEGVYLDIISPTESVMLSEVESPNDTSIVTMLVYGETKMLLTGDAEGSQEQSMLLSDADLRAEIFKAGHHGSRTSNTPAFLRAVRPEFSIVSSGKENPFDHPHLDVILRFDESGIDWVDTKELGTVTLVSDGHTWEVLP